MSGKDPGATLPTPWAEWGPRHSILRPAPMAWSGGKVYGSRYVCLEEYIPALNLRDLTIPDHAAENPIFLNLIDFTPNIALCPNTLRPSAQKNLVRVPEFSTSGLQHFRAQRKLMNLNFLAVMVDDERILIVGFLVRRSRAALTITSIDLFSTNPRGTI